MYKFKLLTQILLTQVKSIKAILITNHHILTFPSLIAFVII